MCSIIISPARKAIAVTDAASRPATVAIRTSHHKAGLGEFLAVYRFPPQPPNKALERNARWRWLVIRKDRWFFHIVGRAWLSYER